MILSLCAVWHLAPEKKVMKKNNFAQLRQWMVEEQLLSRDIADPIICAAATSKIPKLWKEQLKEGGRVVLPLEKNLSQYLVRITKKGKQFLRETFCPVAFVPLISC